MNLDDTTKKYLIGTLAGALAGGGGLGLLSASGGERSGETPEERRSRIVRNALMGAVGGGGGVASAMGVADLLGNAVPGRGILDKWLVEPSMQASHLGRALGGAATGATIGAASSLPGAILRERNLQRLADPAGSGYLEHARRVLKSLIAPKIPANIAKLPHVTSEQKALGALGSLLRRTMARRAGRGALYGAGVGLAAPYLSGVDI